MSFITWEDVDRELDKVEADDFPAIVEVFWRFDRASIWQPSGRRGFINLTNFSAHVGIPRHKFQELVYELRAKETA